MPFGLSRLWLLHCHHSSKHVFPLSVFFSELSMAFFVILICSLYLLCSCKMARAKARNLSVSVSFSSQKKKDQNKFKKHKITTKQTPNKQKTPPSTKPSPTTEIKQQWFLVFAALSLLLKIKITVGSRLKEYISLKEKKYLTFLVSDFHASAVQTSSMTGINCLLLLRNCQKLKPKNVSKYSRPSNTE